MANITLNSEKWKGFPLNSRTRYSSSPLFSNTVLEIPATAIRKRKEIKYINIGREEVKLSLHTNDIIVYIEAPKDYTKKLLEFINKFSKVSGNKTNIHKSVSFFYTNNEISETK